MATALKNLEITDRDIENGAPKPVLAAVSPDPMAMIQRAVELNLDIDKLERLMALRERWQAEQAKAAFVEAMNLFKENAPTIRKNKHVAFGNTSYDHATLDHVCEEVTQALSRNGISHRWEMEQTGEPANRIIRVTCVLTHALGHSEKTSLEGPADASGSKNGIQAIASAVTYLQRYTLLAATGLAAKGSDNDGRGAGDPPKAKLTEDVVKRHIGNIQASPDVGKLQQAFAEAVKLAKAANDSEALNKFITAKDSRKAVLR